MATTSTATATGATGVAGTWTTLTNAQGAVDGTVAGWSSTTSGATATIELTGYNGQTMIGSQPTSIDAVTIDAAQWVTGSAARMASITAQLFSGATSIGATVSLTPNLTVGNSQTVSFGTMPTWAQCTDLRVRLVFTRAAVTQACNAQVDAVGLRIDYTPVVTFLPAAPIMINQAALVRAHYW